MNENSRCSILFHLLVAGGEWQTVMAIPSSSASSCRCSFQVRDRLLLLPPASAQIRIRLAPCFLWRPASFHHRPVLSDLVCPAGNRFALRHGWEIVNVDPVRLSLWPPRPAPVFKGSHQFFLLRVHRQRRISAVPEGGYLPVDVAELLVPVPVLRAFPGLLIQLHRIPHLPQTSCHRFVAHRVALSGQL